MVVIRKIEDENRIARERQRIRRKASVIAALVALFVALFIFVVFLSMIWASTRPHPQPVPIAVRVTKSYHKPINHEENPKPKGEAKNLVMGNPKKLYVHKIHKQPKLDKVAS